jgi:chemotaxis signal transduction protein
MPTADHLTPLPPETEASLLEPDTSALRFRERVRQRTGSTALLVFRIGRERFGVELKAVDEVLEAPEVRIVPEAPPSLRGVFVHRDALVPLYSPAPVLGAEAAPRFVAMVMRWGRRRLALAVDDPEDVIDVDLSALCDAPAGSHEDEVVAGVLWRDGDLVTVLDARSLVHACAAVAMPEDL